MELQLGLAPPSNPAPGFDLNCRVYEPKNVVGSDLLTSRGYEVKKKRTFGEAFEQSTALPLTLPLLLWNGQHPNDEDHYNNPSDFQNNLFATNNNDGDRVVGWPPIKSWKRSLSGQTRGVGAGYNRTVENGGGGGDGGGGSKLSTYVKVKMEGVGITRKVDMSLHHSYETLTGTLIGMFGKCLEDSKDYKLTYQDKEGDWLLAGDVPWRTFIRSVQRLKILRSGG